MITFEQADAADVPALKLRCERVNETRYERTFTREEIHKMLLKQVLDEALISEWSCKRSASAIEVLAAALPETLTVKVVTQE